MAVKNYDIFFTEPDTAEEMLCKVCGTHCNVKRSIHGPTSWAEAMGKRGHLHDTFVCPNSSKPWHERALELLLTAEETPSQSVAGLMYQDLDDLLRANGCDPTKRGMPA